MRALKITINYQIKGRSDEEATRKDSDAFV
jgi:hypothetical protein